MKQFKPVIITLSILVLLAVVCLVAVKTASSGNGDNVPDLPDIQSIKILDIKASDIKSIEFSPSEGKVFAIERKDEVFTVRGEADTLKFDGDKLATTVAYLTPLGASEEIGKDDGESFGLQNPRLYVDITTRKDKRITLVVGDTTPLGDGAYVRLADDDTVYTVSATVERLLFMKREDYRDFTLFNKLPDSMNITALTLTRPGKADIAVREKTEDEKKNSAGYSSNYLITSPVNAEAHPENVLSHLLDKVNGISAVRLIEDHPRDLSRYGLNNPTKLRFSDRDGNTVTLLVGSRTENGGSYVMREGVPSVVETGAAADFRDLTHADIVSSLIWVYNSDDVKKVTYKMGNETHTLELDFRDNTLYGVFDGKEMTGKNPTNLYIHTIRFSVAGEVEKGAKYKDSAMTITIELENGKTETLELCEINERQYAAVRNGRKPEFYINVTELRELINCFEILKNGGDIPAIV